jgi:predicted phage tail protein
MKRVVLRGELGKQFGRIHNFELNTPAEAIRALSANFEGFQQALVTAGERGVGYIVQVGKAAIDDLKEIHNPTGADEEISITPVLAGAGGSSVGKILVGVALVATAFLIGPAAGGFLGIGAGLGGAGGVAAGGAALGLVGGGFATAVGFIGVSMILAGTAQLLSPQPADVPGLTGTTDRMNSFDPARNDPADNRSSYIYNGAVNLTAQGNPVPVCYGRMRVGSVVVSAGVSTTDI